jgi:hypothetical protein
VRRSAFICGCGHTGTTILARILSGHPDVFSVPFETEMFLTGGTLSAWYAAFKYRVKAGLAGKRLFLEKTPRHIHRLDLIRRAVPGARFVVTVRDGRDVVASLSARMKGDVEAAMARWIADTTASANAAARPDTIVVRYEDLVENPAGTLKGVCDFLGISYSPQLLDYHRRAQLWYGRREVRREDDAADNKTRRNWQVNQPLFDGRGRWQAELSAETLRKFQAPEARALMEAFGYTPDAKLIA